VARYWQRFCSRRCRLAHFHEETQAVRELLREQRAAKP
jgi:hypothetical protein